MAKQCDDSFAGDRVALCRNHAFPRSVEETNFVAWER